MLLYLSKKHTDDEKQNGHLVLLDAKAAYDKVIHSHLFRRMYHAVIQDKTWTIIKSLHHNTESCIKWTGSTSDCFKVGMGAGKEVSLALISINYISTHY